MTILTVLAQYFEAVAVTDTGLSFQIMFVLDCSLDDRCSSRGHNSSQNVVSSTLIFRSVLHEQMALLQQQKSEVQVDRLRSPMPLHPLVNVLCGVSTTSNCRCSSR